MTWYRPIVSEKESLGILKGSVGYVTSPFDAEIITVTTATFKNHAPGLFG